MIDNERRKEYDLSTGWTPSGWYSKNRRRPPPANYRKVYAPHAPPDGKWHDAQKHYDFHYGDGQFREAVKNAYNRAKANGEFEYHSPLGKGFAFETKEERKTRYGGNSYYKNPYSKAPQGPLTQQYNYEEGNISARNDRKEARTLLKHKRTVVDKLHERRQDRYEKEKDDLGDPIIPGQKVYTRYNQQSTDNGCIIM